ncbi:MAG: carboxypeptidase regulatory-like domain-containing protein [Terriglobia bacterium]
MIRKIMFLLTATLMLSAPTLSLRAQAAASSADLTGTVLDSSKAVIPGATVTATNTATQLMRSAVCNPSGEYRLSLLPPGSYDVKAEAAGFTTGVKKGIVLTVGQVAVVGFELSVGAQATEVVVSGEAPIVETERSAQSATITQTPIANLPINGRNFLDFTLLTPGVVEANPTINTLQQIPNSGLSFGGQNARSNSVAVDGVSFIDDASNGVRPTVSQEAVQEFQINRSGYNAEFGGGSSGSVNIITKSGTNELHGNVFEFFRHEKLDARNPLDFSERTTGTRSPFKRNQPGFTLGGPIKKDRTFFFVSYEALIQRESSFVTAFPDVAALQPTSNQTALANFLAHLPPSPQTAQLIGLGQILPLLLSTAPTPPPQFLATLPPFAQQLATVSGNTFNMLKNADGRVPFRNTNNNASLRLDHQFNAKDQLFGRFSFFSGFTFGTRVGGQDTLTHGTTVKEQQEDLILTESHIFNDRVINELRFQFARHVFDLNTIDPFGPAIFINGIANFGRDFNNPTLRTGKRWQWGDNISYTHGKHAFKFGGEVNYLPFNNSTVAIFLGGEAVFTNQIPLFFPLAGGLGLPTAAALNQFLITTPGSPFSSFTVVPGIGPISNVLLAPLTSLQAFNAGIPAFFDQGFGNPITSQANTQLDGYAQDSWKVTPRLQLNYGLRYFAELQPSPLHRDLNNFAPRFGFAYDPFGSGKTVIRGGYGIFYSPLYQSVAFASRVLGGRQIQNILRLFNPATPTTDASAIWHYIYANTLGRRTITAQEMQSLFGLTAGPPTLTTQEVDPNVVNTYVQQVSFGIDHEIGKDWSLSVDYMWNKGNKVIRNIDRNLRATGSVPGIGAIFQGTNSDGTSNGNFPGFVARFFIETSASSSYNGMSFALNKRMSHHFQLSLAYTLSKAIDDSTDLNQDLAPFDSNNLHNEKALSSFDVRQRFVFSAVMETPWKAGSGNSAWQRVLADFTVAPIVTARSGFPFNLLAGVDLNNDLTTNTDRPPFVGRNTGLGPGFMAFDMRISKRFRFGESKSLDFIWEGFNLLNRTNFKNMNSIVGINPTRRDGDPTLPPSSPFAFTQAYDPRQLQFAIKINF